MKNGSCSPNSNKSRWNCIYFIICIYLLSSFFTLHPRQKQLPAWLSLSLISAPLWLIFFVGLLYKYRESTILIQRKYHTNTEEVLVHTYMLVHRLIKCCPCLQVATPTYPVVVKMGHAHAGMGKVSKKQNTIAEVLWYCSVPGTVSVWIWMIFLFWKLDSS